MAGRYRKEQGQGQRKRFTVYLEPGLYDHVHDMSQRDRRSMSAMVEVLVEEALEFRAENEEPQDKRGLA